MLSQLTRDIGIGTLFFDVESLVVFLYWSHNDNVLQIHFLPKSLLNNRFQTVCLGVLNFWDMLRGGLSLRTNLWA